MVRGILKQGVIHPLEPLPADWSEGTELGLEKLNKETPNGDVVDSVDKWMDEVESLAAEVTAEDDESFARAIAEVRRQAKEMARQGRR